MRDYLLSNLTDEERAYIASLREDDSLSPEEFVTAVFAELDDPLLSAEDVAALWGEGADAEGLVNALTGLVTEGALEASEKTQRPFDALGVRLYRRADTSATRLTLTALQSEDHTGESRFQFSVEGRLVRGIARIDRLDALAGSGQQRDEIKAHVTKIRQGVESGTHVPNPVLLVMLEESTQVLEVGEDVTDDIPNSFVVVRPLEEFQEVRRENGALVQKSRIVELMFPWRRAAFDEEKSVLLVDGQQRTAAISLVAVEALPFIDLGVSAVISNDEKAKRVFQVANDSVKISTDFSKALLASMEDAPGYLKDEQITAEVVRLLVLEDEKSPFYGLVKYPGVKSAGTVVAYNSVFGIVSAFRRNLPE
ncbi:MAG: hypothetical protein ACTHMW_15440, partial [Actinomycetes bacterium]